MRMERKKRRLSSIHSTQSFPHRTLPISEYKDHILSVLEKNQVVVCIGETGSGKTTQIPQFLDAAGYTIGGKCIAITQPRRVAAISSAQRVAEEMKCTIGAGPVAYIIRFDDQSTTNTRIKFMTDGILLRECLVDPLLMKYSVIMLDEAHERSTNCDILLGLLKSLVGKRPDIKILITSATLDSSRFVSFFKGTCVIEIPGRSFPVQIYHSKQAQVMGQNGPISAYVNSVVETTLQVHFSEPEGHILVFLTGHREVEDVCLQLLQRERKVKAKNGEEMRMKILPLYSSLPNNVQRKIFKSVPHNVRKVVVATNIAETSITVEGIKYVIDCGFTKQKAYDPTRNIESLMVVPISQVSAQQRAGRAGRTAPGKCFRLYSKDAYEKMLPATVPEIKRTNLANVLLNLKVLGIHDVIGFNYIDHPGNDLIFDGLKQLFLLGAIDESGKCTEIGKSMSKYPLEPKLARALIEAEKLGCASEMLVIVSMLSCGDIFVNTASSDVLSDKENYMFLMKDENLIDSAGDHLSYLRIFWVWSNQTNKYDWCRQRRLNRKSLLLANSIMLQLKQIMGSTSDLQIHNFKNIPSEKIRKAVCAGYYMNFVRRCGNMSIYRVLQDDDVQFVHLHPFCVLNYFSLPEYCIFHDHIRTTNAFIKHVIEVNHRWIEEYASKKHVTQAVLYRMSGHSSPQRQTVLGMKVGQTESDIVRESTQISMDNKPSYGNKIDAARARYLARQIRKQ